MLILVREPAVYGFHQAHDPAHRATPEGHEHDLFMSSMKTGCAALSMAMSVPVPVAEVLSQA